MNALLFLYRHVLGVNGPWLNEAFRAKRPHRIPAPLTQAKVSALRSVQGARSTVLSEYAITPVKSVPLPSNGCADSSVIANRGILQEVTAPPCFDYRGNLEGPEGWIAARQSRLACGLTLARQQARLGLGSGFALSPSGRAEGRPAQAAPAGRTFLCIVGGSKPAGQFQ